MISVKRERLTINIHTEFEQNKNNSNTSLSNLASTLFNRINETHMQLVFQLCQENDKKLLHRCHTDWHQIL